MSAPTDKLLVFLTEGPEGWDTPIADLVAACGDMGQKAMLIDLTKPDASALLNKAASAGVTAFVSMEGIGARMTANGRSIFELLQAPLLTFLPDHPCFYAPLLTTPQKLVVPMFFSQEHVTAARGIYGNVPLAPIVEPWGPRTLELEGEPVPAVFIDASMFDLAASVESLPAPLKRLLQTIVGNTQGEQDIYFAEVRSGPLDARQLYEAHCRYLGKQPDADGLGDDVYAAVVRVFDTHWLPLRPLVGLRAARLCQLVVARARAEQVRARTALGGPLVAFGSGWPNVNERALRAALPNEFPVVDSIVATQCTSTTDLLTAHRTMVRAGLAPARTPPVLTFPRVAESALFLDVALPSVT